MSQAKSQKPALVEPRTLRGFQDFLPGELLLRKRAIRTLEAVFERYGFNPVDTPAMEYLDVLLGAGGENANKELFRLETPEGEPIALRFDLTVPFSRLLVQYPDRLKPPFRRYAIGTVWRGDRPGPGRFREFTQCDIDVAGSPTVASDAEVIAVLAEGLRALGAPNFRIAINNRKLIDALLDDCGIHDTPTQKHVLRVIDKLAKVGLDNIRLELGPGRIDESGDPIPGVKLTNPIIDKILDFIAITGESRTALVDRLAGVLPDSDPTRDALAEMRELADALDALGVPGATAPFDPSLARGLDYYTGPVFEVILPDAPQFGSVGGGGRYDGLVSRFSHQAIPCTGASIGLDRLLPALLHLGAQQPASTTVEALIVTMGNVPKAETLRLAQELRNAGIATEAFFASRKKMQMGNQLSHADHYGIPVAVIVGEDELAQGLVSVKDLVAGKNERAGIEDREAYREAGKTGQITIPRAELIATVLGMLGR